MNISKISRGLVVAIFAVVIFSILMVGIYTSTIQVPTYTSSINKLVYVVMLILLTVIYVYIKSKFTKKKIKKSISLTYRYLYMMLATIGIKITYHYLYFDNIHLLKMLLSVLIMVGCAVLLKRIIYNISKSDILSVVGTFMYSLYPVTMIGQDTLIHSSLILLITLAVIMIMQKIIDELKQLGLKNKKYIVLSILCGILICIAMVLGIHSVIWLLLGIILIFITSNLDKTHLNFPNKMIQQLRQRNKELLYRLERIYINKIYIVIGIIFVISFGLYQLVCLMNVETVEYFGVNNNVMHHISLLKEVGVHAVVENMIAFCTSSNLFYILLMAYIVIIEILTVLLRRRYDTKSTVIKCLYMFIFASYIMIQFEVVLYQQVLVALLILISIISTSNLYLNRDERIKLLNS